MANTGGGYILIGAANDGSSSNCDLTATASLDQAVVVDKIGKYTDAQPNEVNVRLFRDKRRERVIFHVGAADPPIVLCRPGTYAVSDGKQKTAYSAGTIYFRHGSKSEPARQADIQRAFDSMFAKRKREFLSGIRKVIKARADEQVLVLPKAFRLTTDATAPGFRITDDPDAPAFRGIVGAGKYGSEEEELAGIVRNMKTDPEAYAAGAQLWRFYAHRKVLNADAEAMKCLLVSAVYRRCPPYYWAMRLGAEEAVQSCRGEADKDVYPAIQVIVRMSYAIGGNTGRHILERTSTASRYPSARKLAKHLLPTMGMPGRVWREYGSKTIRVQDVTGPVLYPLDSAEPDEAEKLIDKALLSAKNRGVTKRLDALVYGSMLERMGRSAQ